MRYRFLYVGADLRKLVLQPDTTKHCKTADTGQCITRRACLLSQLSPGTHFSLLTVGWLRLNKHGRLVLRQRGYPS